MSSAKIHQYTTAETNTTIAFIKLSIVMSDHPHGSPFSQAEWDAIETVLLDMDGTLLDLHFDNYFWLEYLPVTYANKHQLSEQAAKDELFTAFSDTRGTLNWYCLDYWSERLGLDIAKLKLDVEEKIAYRPYVKDFLQLLKQQGKRAVIVTNAHRDSVDLKMRHTQLNALVDRVISSHDYQEPKESQIFWEGLVREEPFDKSRTLLIDDNQAVLKTAQNWGIRHLLTIYHPDSQQPANTDSEHDGIHHFDTLIHHHSNSNDHD